MEEAILWLSSSGIGFSKTRPLGLQVLEPKGPSHTQHCAWPHVCAFVTYVHTLSFLLNCKFNMDCNWLIYLSISPDICYSDFQVVFRNFKITLK